MLRHDFTSLTSIAPLESKGKPYIRTFTSHCQSLLRSQFAVTCREEACNREAKLILHFCYLPVEAPSAPIALSLICASRQVEVGMASGCLGFSSLR